MPRRAANTPTYKVVGPLERFDERDSLFASEWLTPGSSEAKEYYSHHPEREERDQFLRGFVGRKYELNSRRESAEQDVFFPSVFSPATALALPDVVDGPVSAVKADVDPAKMTTKLKRLGRTFGADIVGVGPLNQAWVYSHRGCPPFFSGYRPNPPLFQGIPPNYSGLGWGDPIELSHQYAIAMGFRQNYDLISTGPASAAELEMSRVYVRSAVAAVQLAAYIRALGYPARAHHVRNYGITVVPVAVDSGLGEVGRCGYLVTRELGANLRLSAVTTSLPLTLDGPVNLSIQEFCSTCDRCAANCPVDAIPRGDKVVARGVLRWKIDAHRCLGFWVRKGSVCGICQVVCPWSARRDWVRTVFAQTAIRVGPARRFLARRSRLGSRAQFTPSPLPKWMDQP